MTEHHLLNDPGFRPAVLIVDDDADHRMAVAFVFKRRGYVVHYADCGEQAWKICEKELIHLIVTDVCMGGGTGIDLLNRVRKRDRNFPAVFLMTGHSYVNLDDAATWGADAVFEKPLDRQALMAASQEALSKLGGEMSHGR